MPSCTICQTPSNKKLTATCRFTGRQLVRHVCPKCGLIFGPSGLISCPLSKIIEITRGLNFVEGLTDFEYRSFRLLKPRKGGQYLSYGCGMNPYTLDRIRGEGFDIVGFDPAACHPFVVTDPAGLGRYDGIISNNLLEHLQDPVGQFVEWGRLLRPGGVMAHSTPCYRYCYEDNLLHLHFYVGGSVAELCGVTGFRVLRWYSEFPFVVVLFAGPE